MKIKKRVCKIVSLMLALCVSVAVMTVGVTANAVDVVSGSLTKNSASSAVTVKAADNEGVSYDINGYRKDKDGVRYIYLFMPSRADLSELKVTFSDGSVETMNLTEPIDCTLNNGVVYKMIAMQSKIPTLYIQIDESKGTIASMNGDPNHDTKCYGEVVLDVPDELAEANGWDTSYVDLSMEIKGRGNTTWGLPKKPYQIKLDEKQDILGMGKHKTWIILANDSDRSLIRNKLAYDLADELGMEFSPQCEFVDVFMNGTYMGNYLLTEKIEVGTNRVEIQDLEDDEANYEDWVTGGYLLEYDRLAYSEATMIRGGFTGMPITVKTPEVATPDQKSYIQTLVNDMEAAIYSPDGYNSKGKYYTDYIDAESMCKLNWVNEIFKNGDYFYGSTYFYKDVGADSLMYAGPVWDFDITLANACANAGAGTAERQANLANPQGWWVRTVADGFGKMMFQHEDFIELDQKIYQEEIKPLLSKLGDRAQQEADAIRESADMNFIVWDVLESGHTWSTPNTATTYQGEVDFVKNYLSARSDWIDYAMLSGDYDYGNHGLTLEGMGTEVNPYLIKTPDDLKQVASVSDFNNNFKDKYFLLANDIDMSGIDWTPICTTSAIDGGNSFAGIFDGNYHEISNLNIPGINSATFGLFGMVSGTVKNLGLSNVTVNSGSADCRSGALVGTLSGGTVENCYVVNSSVTATNRVAGGMVGQNYNGLVKGCYTYNTIETGARFGSLVGDNEDDDGNRKGTISGSYTTGPFSSTNIGIVTGGQENVPAASFQDGTVVAALNANAEGMWKQGAQYPVFALEPYVPQPPMEEFDYERLREIYTEGSSYQADDYTAESYERLDELLQIAKGYLEGTMGSDISQDEIDLLAAELEEAIANLEEKYVPQPPVIEPGDSEQIFEAMYDFEDMATIATNKYEGISWGATDWSTPGITGGNYAGLQGESGFEDVTVYAAGGYGLYEGDSDYGTNMTIMGTDWASHYDNINFYTTPVTSDTVDYGFKFKTWTTGMTDDSKDNVGGFGEIVDSTIYGRNYSGNHYMDDKIVRARLDKAYGYAVYNETTSSWVTIAAWDELGEHPNSTWHDIKYVLDLDTKTYTVYLNGAEKGTFPFSNQGTVTAIDGIQFNTLQMGDSYGSSAYWIDDVWASNTEAGDVVTFVCGDVNGDGAADGMDASLIMLSTTGGSTAAGGDYEIGAEIKGGNICGDVNGDGAADGMDASLIMLSTTGGSTAAGGEYEIGEEVTL